MTTRNSNRTSLMLLALLFALGGGSVSGQAAVVPPARFPTPETAMQALAAAGRAKDQAALGKLFGSAADLLTGDPVEDAKDFEEFHGAVQEAVELRKDSDSKYTVLIGKDKFPFPLPIVKRDAQWFFDAKAGIEELFNRRIGENELSAIATCRAYALAQWEYFTEADHDSDGVAEYAQHLNSLPGQMDGLYWETGEGEKRSPFGKLVSEVRAEGYDVKKRGQPRLPGALKGFPYHGYHFRILKAQGPHAPGGRYNYIINGNMIAGYAMIAYPDKWGASGVMTFIINQQGRVYQKNLGAASAAIASAMTEYDPDTTWKLVEP